MSNTTSNTSNISASTANKTVYKHKLSNKKHNIQSKPHHTLSQVDSHWFDTGFLGFDWLSKAIAIMLVIMNAIMLAMTLLAPYDYAADDSWKVDDPRGGHAAYIWWMSDNHLFSLPSWDTRIVINHVLRADSGGLWSWNNPPLYYWLTAIPVWLMRALANIMPSLGLDAGDCMKAAQVLQALFAVLLVIACVRFMRRLGLDGIWLAFAGMLMMTIPCLYYASFRVGNDVLMSLFAVLAFTKLIDWWLKPSAMNSMMVGLYAGLAALTKVNGVLVAVVAFIVFMVRLAIWVHERSHESLESNGWKGKNAGMVAVKDTACIEGDDSGVHSASCVHCADNQVQSPGLSQPRITGTAAGDADISKTHDTVSRMHWWDWLWDAIMFTIAFIPLGLGYHVYEWVRFRVPFFYVQRMFYPWEPVKGLAQDNEAMTFYKGFPWWSRLVGSDCIAYTRPSVNISYDPCIPTVAVKTFTVSFFRARNGFMLACQWFTLIMGFIMFLVLILCLFGMFAHAVRIARSKSFLMTLSRNPGWLVAATALLVWLPFYVFCCYREPAISTPNVRYIMMLFTVFIACITWVCRRLMSDAVETTHDCKHSDANDVNKTNERIACMTRVKAHRAIGWVIIVISCVFAFACMLTVLTLTVQMGTGLALS